MKKVHLFTSCEHLEKLFLPLILNFCFKNLRNGKEELGEHRRNWRRKNNRKNEKISGLVCWKEEKEILKKKGQIIR